MTGVMIVNAAGVVHWDVAGGRARLASEAARVAEVKARGAVPDACGPEYAEAPARGCFRVVETQALYPAGADGFKARGAGFAGRKTIERQDVFGQMMAQAARGGRAAPLSSAQVAMGRFYRDLHERHACAGLRCSSMEAMPGGGGGSYAGFMDAVLSDRDKLDQLRARIGNGPAPRLRVLRPSARGSRVTIGARALVDGVCLEQLHLDAVLRRHGWSVKGETRKAARAALSEVLEAMLGHRRGRGITGASFGDGPGSIWSLQKGD